jgi:hypothetical protein
MVSLLDIGAMKLNAIFHSGRRLKDFVDIYSILEKYTLNELLDACNQKYSEINIHLVKNSLIYHSDIRFSDPIQYLGTEIKWPEIENRLKEAFNNPNKICGLSEMTRTIINKKQSKPKKRENKPRL